MSKFLADQWNQATDEMDSFFAEMDAKISKAKQIPEITFSELSKRYPKHLQALAHPTMQEAARMVRIYTRITGEKPPRVNDAIAFIAKRNAIAEYKREWRNLAR